MPASPKKATKTARRKSRKPRDYPKYEQMIAEAITALKDRTGSSRYAIHKYVQENYTVPMKTLDTQLSIQLRNLVKSGKLVKEKASYLLSAAFKESIRTGKPMPSKRSSPKKRDTSAKKTDAESVSESSSESEETKPAEPTKNALKKTPAKNEDVTKKEATVKKSPTESDSPKKTPKATPKKASPSKAATAKTSSKRTSRTPKK